MCVCLNTAGSLLTSVQAHLGEIANGQQSRASLRFKDAAFRKEPILSPVKAQAWCLPWLYVVADSYV